MIVLAGPCPKGPARRARASLKTLAFGRAGVSTHGYRRERAADGSCSTLLETQHYVRIRIPQEHPPLGAAWLRGVVRVHEDVVAESGEIHEAVLPHLAPGVLPQLEGDRDARSAPAQRDVRRAVLEIDPAAVGAASGDVRRSALGKRA